MKVTNNWLEHHRQRWADELAKSLGVRRVPVHLPLERAWRWCVLATVRDLRLSRHRHGAMSLPNTQRLFRRRWAEVCHAHGLADTDSYCGEQQRLGNQFIREVYPKCACSR